MVKKSKTVSRQDKKVRRQNEKATIEEIKQRANDLTPEEYKTFTNFKELPLTLDLVRGLDTSGFVKLTEIQKLAIPECLKGNDVLAAAKTGSGKTLSFLIPVVEKLIFESWSDMDGLGALIITPTRELAVQIYEVLLKIGKFTQLSAGLVIGGKDYNFEKDRVGRVNILIGTPGRLLQHMDESATLHTDNLQMLVLDEADRILDMGFRKTLDAILGQLPASRQTLLFSATQTKSVGDLARLSMVEPKYINSNLANGGRGGDELDLPESLEQSYVIVPLNEKLSLLWSFIKSHLQAKILVFVSSSKQVHFIYEIFRKLQPGIPLMKLHGRQKQKARLETSLKFTQSKNCCLFATDVVARGLDFPAIDWVIQLDCPEDVSTYVHRVGRCARFGRQGKAMLMLMPSEEEGFVTQLNSKKIDVKKLNIKGSKKKNIQPQIQSLCFNSAELKYLAQKAFISYCKSVIIQKNKSVFKIDQLPLDTFAASYGLPGMPKLKIPKKATGDLDDEARLKLKEKKNENRKLKSLANANDDGEFEKDGKKVRTKLDKMFERKNQNVLSTHYMELNTEINGKPGDNSDDEDDDDEFLTVKRKDNEVKTEDLPELEINTSKRAMKKALSRKLTAQKTGKGARLVFDDEGNSHPVYELDDEKDFLKEGPAKVKSEFLSTEKEKMSKEDEIDKGIAKDKRTEKKRRRKELERQLYADDSEDEELQYTATLGSDKASDSEDIPNLENDLQYSDDEEPENKKQKKWFESDKYKERDAVDTGLVEIEQPENIDDLEALTLQLMQ